MIVEWRKAFGGRVLHALERGTEHALCGMLPSETWHKERVGDTRARCLACRHVLAHHLLGTVQPRKAQA